MRSAALVLAAAAGAHASADPCGGACAAPTSLCCADSPSANDWACCIAQTTYCVPPRGPFVTATCCPRWTVSCTVGSVGCCDPARPWQLLGASAPNATSRVVARRPGHAVAEWGQGGKTEAEAAEAPTTTARRSGNGVAAHALFTTTFGLSVLTVSVPEGNVTAKHSVTGPVKDYYKLYYGASTRVFPYDAKNGRFVFADVDAAQALTVYTVDGQTGSSTAQKVSGASGYAVGMAFDEGAGCLVVTTQTDSAASFFCVDADSGAATALGSVARGADESSDSYYAAYASAAFQGTVYRVGNLAVSKGTGVGVQVTKVGGGKASSDWKQLPLAPGHGLPVSTSRNGADGFVSLSAGSSGSFDAVAWSVDGSATVLATFANAHSPTFSEGALGYVADAVGHGVYAALAVQLNPSPVFPGMEDKWVLCSVPVAGGAGSEMVLTPGFLGGANTVGLAGFGIAA